MIRHIIQKDISFSMIKFLKFLSDNEKEYKLLIPILLELKNSGSLDETFYKLVTPDNFRTPIAYFLAKTHKFDFSTNLKFRPIISSYDSFSFKLAKEISNVLNNTLLQNGKHGTLDFVTKLKNLEFSGHFKMLSLDIESLFLSIPLDETIGIATEYFLNILDKI